MPSHYHLSLLAALLCLPTFSSAATFNRCEDSAGNITFTSQSCPAGHERRLQEAYNAPPGSGTVLLPPAERGERYTSKASSGPVKEQEILVVGEREDGCGNRLSAEQRRKAIINRQTPPGMNVRDVESMLGKPDSIVNRNGELRYTYKDKNRNGRSDSVSFDQYGCVKDSRQRR